MCLLKSVTGLTILSSVNPLNALPLNTILFKCISINNQECKVRPQIVNVNEDDPVFCPYNVKTSKCSGSCNNINNPLAKVCVPDVVKNLNIKVINLVSGINETRRIEWHETCKCKCRFNNIVCNNKQKLQRWYMRKNDAISRINNSNLVDKKGVLYC